METILAAIGAVGSAIAAVFKAINSIFGWLRDRTMRQMGRQDQVIDDAQNLNELQNEANKIEATPPMSPDEQLDWMRRKNKSD